MGFAFFGGSKMICSPVPAETTPGHLRLVVPLRGGLLTKNPVSSFGGRSVGRTVSRLSFGMLEALRTLKKGLRQNTS